MVRSLTKLVFAKLDRKTLVGKGESFFVFDRRVWHTWHIIQLLRVFTKSNAIMGPEKTHWAREGRCLCSELAHWYFGGNAISAGCMSFIFSFHVLLFFFVIIFHVCMNNCWTALEFSLDSSIVLTLGTHSTFATWRFSAQNLVQTVALYSVKEVPSCVWAETFGLYIGGNRVRECNIYTFAWCIPEEVPLAQGVFQAHSHTHTSNMWLVCI